MKIYSIEHMVDVGKYLVRVVVTYGLFRLSSKHVFYIRDNGVWKHSDEDHALVEPYDAQELEKLFCEHIAKHPLEEFKETTKEPLWTFVGKMESEYYRMQAFFKVEAQSNVNSSKVNTTPSFISIAFPDTSAGNPFEAGVEYEITIRRKQS